MAQLPPCGRPSHPLLAPPARLAHHRPSSPATRPTRALAQPCPRRPLPTLDVGSSQAAATSRWQANQTKPPLHALVRHPVGPKCHPQGGTEAASTICLQSLSPSPRRLLVSPYKPRSSAFRQEPRRLLGCPCKTPAASPAEPCLAPRTTEATAPSLDAPFSKLLASLTCLRPWMRATSRRPSNQRHGRRRPTGALAGVL